MTAIATPCARAVARRQRVGARVRRAEHRLLDGDAGLVRADSIAPRAREIVRALSSTRS